MGTRPPHPTARAGLHLSSHTRPQLHSSSCPLRLCPKPCTFLRAKPGNASCSKRLSNPVPTLPYHPIPTAHAPRVSLVLQKEGQGEERRAVEQEGTRWSTIPIREEKEPEKSNGNVWAGSEGHICSGVLGKSLSDGRLVQ